MLPAALLPLAASALAGGGVPQPAVPDDVEMADGDAPAPSAQSAPRKVKKVERKYGAADLRKGLRFH